MNWYISVLKKYAVFSGRARRREFWSFMVISLLISFVLGLIEEFLGLGFQGVGVITSIYSLIIIVPGLAVTMRRFHDIGRSGWWMSLPAITIVSALISGGVAIASNLDLIPEGTANLTVVGVFLLLSVVVGLALIVFLLKDSQPRANAYGPNPKEEAQEESQKETQEGSP